MQQKKIQGPVVRKMDSAIRLINLYPEERAIGFPNTYPPDRDLSDGAKNEIIWVSNHLLIFKDFTIDILLRQEWIDRRLRHRLNQTITLNGGARKTKIWIPDSYFLNAKAAKMHKVTAPNVMFMIDPSGNIKYNAR